MGKIRSLAIERVRDSITWVEATIHRDRQRKDYSAMVGEGTLRKPIRVRADQAADLVRKLRQKLRSGLGLPWSRAIILEPALPPRFYSRAVAKEALHVQLAYGLARGEIATRKDGRILFRDWPPEGANDDERPEILLPDDNRIVSVLPPRVLIQSYSDARWQALRELALQVARLSEAVEHAEDMEAFRRAVDLRAFQRENANAGKRQRPSDFDPEV